MLNCIILYYLVGIVFNYIKGGSVSSSLNCGIWSFVGKNPKDFNLYKFMVLGIKNDPRGGDAAGMVIDNTIFHETHVEFNQLIKKYKVPEPKRYPIVLGHTRKASNGGKLIEYTQPFVINNSKKILGIGCHNGTINNNEELIKKYKVPEKFSYKKETELISYVPNDTQILFYILIKNKDYSVLENYEGSAALIWHDRELNKVFVFKGASKKYKMSTVIEEERPLFLYHGKEGMWLSSVLDGLQMISDDKSVEIHSIPDNNLITIENGIITNVEIINRENNTQYNYKSTNNYSNNYNNFNDYRDREDSGYNYTQPSLALVSSEISKYMNEPVDSTEKNLIQFKAGRFYKYDGELAKGIIHLDELGYISPARQDDACPYYFIDGVMIRSHKEYREAKNDYKKVLKGNYTPNSAYMADTLDKKLMCALLPYTDYPLNSLDDKKGETFEYNSRVKNKRYFTGSITPLFSDMKYIFQCGDIVRSEQTDKINCADHSKGYTSSIPGDYDSVLDTDENNDDVKEWAEEYEKTNLSSKFTEIWTLLEQIEVDTLVNADLKISQEANDLVETLKTKLRLSSFNI